MNEEALFEKLVSQSLTNSQMFDFIRAEYLNLIIERKKFVKDEKERIKGEMKQLKLKQIAEKQAKLEEEE